MHLAYVGAIAGGVIGILGAIFGTWCSIAGTKGPRERRFMVQAAAAMWIGVAAFVAGMLLVPSPYNYVLWIPYGVALLISIVWTNRRQAGLREEEAPRQK